MDEGGSRLGVSLYEGALRGEPGGRTILQATPKDILINALEMCVSFQSIAAFEEHEETTLS
jgi:hypothetical protein